MKFKKGQEVWVSYFYGNEMRLGKFTISSSGRKWIKTEEGKIYKADTLREVKCFGPAGRIIENMEEYEKAIEISEMIEKIKRTNFKSLEDDVIEKIFDILKEV